MKLLEWGEDGFATEVETAALRASFKHEFIQVPLRGKCQLRAARQQVSAARLHSMNILSRGKTEPNLHKKKTSTKQSSTFAELFGCPMVCRVLQLQLLQGWYCWLGGGDLEESRRFVVFLIWLAFLGRRAWTEGSDMDSAIGRNRPSVSLASKHVLEYPTSCPLSASPPQPSPESAAKGGAGSGSLFRHQKHQLPLHWFPPWMITLDATLHDYTDLHLCTFGRNGRHDA